jgi:hypothetical protein
MPVTRSSRRADTLGLGAPSMLKDEEVLISPSLPPTQRPSQAATSRVLGATAFAPGSPTPRRVFRPQESADPTVGSSSRFKLVKEEDLGMSALPAAGSLLVAPPDSPDEDPALAKDREVKEALAALRPSLSDVATRSLIDKIQNVQNVSAIGQLIPTDFRSCVVDFLGKYNEDVVCLGAVSSKLAKLRHHAENGTFPTTLNSIKEPRIQWSREILGAPVSDRVNSTEDAASQRFLFFESIIDRKVIELKRELLWHWIREKERELALFQKAAHADSGIQNLRLALGERISELRKRFVYTIDGGSRLEEPMPPWIREFFDSCEFYHEVLFHAAPSIVGKINSIISLAKDCKPADTPEKIEPVVDRAAEMPANNGLSTLQKILYGLGKDVSASQKVRRALEPVVFLFTDLYSFDL